VGLGVSSYKLRILGITVAEIVCDEPEVVVRIDNTGGQFEIAETYSESDDWEYEEDSSDFGFRGASV
jgi:hypothetical protein